MGNSHLLWTRRQANINIVTLNASMISLWMMSHKSKCSKAKIIGVLICSFMLNSLLTSLWKCKIPSHHSLTSLAWLQYYKDQFKDLSRKSSQISNLQKILHNLETYMVLTLSKINRWETLKRRWISISIKLKSFQAIAIPHHSTQLKTIITYSWMKCAASEKN